MRFQTNKKGFTPIQSGFTLVELMVTISIMAVLATVGVVVYANAQGHARDGKRRADLREIQKALEQHYTSSGDNSYPDATTGIYGTSPINSTTYFNKGSTPKDPSGTDYSYVAPSDPCKKFIICADLEKDTGNRSAAATLCTDAVEDTGTGFYCLGSLQN